MKTKTEPRNEKALEALLGEARAEADDLRIRLDRFEKILLSTRLIMGHELKKPTTAVSGYLDLVLENMDEDKNPRDAELLYKALSECELLNELNLFFLELLKIDNETEDRHGSQVTIRGFVDGIICHVRQDLNPRKRVATRISPDVQQFKINPNAFKIILNNVIENALKYSPDDSRVVVEIKQQADKRSVSGGDIIRIQVRDEGVGIPERYLKNIFKPFVRLDDVTEGSGLGLTLVRSLVELNGGNIYIRSEEQNGTTVDISLPESNSGDQDETS